MAALAVVGTVGAAGTSVVAAAQREPPADPAVVADREERAIDDAGVSHAPPAVTPAPPTTPGIEYFKDLYWLRAKQTTGGYIELAARDNPAQDKPGLLTTTMRIYGNAAAWRTGNGNLGLESQFTCTGSGVSSVTIGAGGSISVTGGPASQTLKWVSLRESASELRQWYSEGGHFRCKVYNTTPAKFTRRGIASANYKGADTRAQDEYSFWW